MGVEIRSPRFSFVRFGTQDNYQTCNPLEVQFCLPIYAHDDIAFQFVAIADTAAEADALCDFANDLVTVGLVDDCDSDFSLNFKTAATLTPERFRIGEKQVLYNWAHGIPGFDSIYNVDDCFRIKILIEHPTAGDITACSNCLQRIPEDCYTSVIQYGSTQNVFDFNYCGGGDLIEEDESPCPEATIIQFIDAETLSIPYTAVMAANYGAVPTVEVFILDNGEYIKPVIRVGFDAYPPTTIIADLGGMASGYIKIS